MIQDVVEYGIGHMLNMDIWTLLRTFWIFFIFDFPRYVLSDIYIFFYELMNRFKYQRYEDLSVFENKFPPLVSVIVPVLNEEDTIEWTIRSLREQTYKNIEIIVVDDGSTDKTPEICSKLRDEKQINYTRFDERAGKSAALNYGLKGARGKYIVFVDSDTTFDRDAVSNILKPFHDPKVGAISGNLLVRNKDRNILTSLQQIEYLFTISMARRFKAQVGILPLVSGAFGAFRREVISLEKIGGHEPGPGNDSDLTLRVRKLGYKVAFTPDAICYTKVPEDFYRFLKQRWRWDRNLIKNRMRKHRDILNPFSKNFRFIDAWSSIDTIFFHFILAIVTLTYVIDMLLNFPHVMPLIFLMNYLLYFVAETVQLIIALILVKRTEYVSLFVYLPFLNPYKIILKFFRLIGYTQEIFFRYSSHDPFAPYKVRRKLIPW